MKETLVLTLVLSKTASVGTRQVAQRFGGIPLGAMLTRIRGRLRCSVVCGGSRMGRQGRVAQSFGSTSLRRILSTMLSGKLSCSIRNGVVIVSGGRTTKSSVARRGRVVIGNVIGSRGNRPIIKTGIIRGKASGNAVASVSKGFSLSVSRNSGLDVACVKCLSGSITIDGNGAALGVRLGRSARTLSRIIIMNCNSIGGHSLAKSISRVSSSSVRGRTIVGSPVRTLRNGVTNTSVAVKGSPKTSSAVIVHKCGSVGTNGSPLVIISSTPFKKGVSRVGPTRVRSVSILGSTSSATVCNSQKTGNIIVVAAGHTHGRTGLSIDCSKCINISGSFGGCSVVDNRGCTS